jgi:hypothetical protein
LIARVGGEALRPDPGSIVRLVADEKDLYLFDAATGESLR